MANPTIRQTGRTATLATNLTSSGSETSINITVASTSPVDDQAGVAKIGLGTAAEWVSFTGVTTVSSTLQTLTGCNRGLKQNATSLTDTDAAIKKGNSIGSPVRIVHHSAEINNLLQKVADDTVTGTLSFSNLVSTPLNIPLYTVAERDALTTATNGAIIIETDNGKMQARVGGNWLDLEMGTVSSFMTDSAAGIGQLATSAEKQALTGIDSVTSAPLLIRNDDTERTLHPSNTNTTDTMSIGGGSTGDRATSLFLDGSDANAGFSIERAAGENGATTITSNGTGDVDLTSGGAISLTSAASQDITFTPGAGGEIVLSGSISNGTIGSYEAFSYTSGELLAAGDWVYYKGADNKVWKATNTAIDTAAVLGVVITGGAADTTVTIQESGVYTTTGLTADTDYYLSTGGSLTPTAVSTGSASIVPIIVGRAVSTTKLQITKNRLARTLILSHVDAISSATTTTTITVGMEMDVVTFYSIEGAGNYFINASAVWNPGGTNTRYYQYLMVNTSIGTSASGSSPSYIVRLLDTDGSGTMTAVPSVVSDDIRLTWSQGGSFATTLAANITAIVSEKI